MTTPGAADFGVYIHVPFCASRCDYCAFATWTDRGHLASAYVDALVADVRRRVAEGMPPATSVFVGGGTPSLLPPGELGRVLDAVPRLAGAEVTVECNPDDVTPVLAAGYRESGVNRISLGVQSMVPAVLDALGRRHDPAAVRTAVDAVRSAGVPSLNVDLIYGAAGESIADWDTTLTDALALAPDHVSAYALTVEAGTALAGAADRHPDEDDQADKYELATDRLGAAGLAWYEISNWARPGHQCRHNLLYWTQGEYQGIGCAAHSHRDGRRSWNVRTPDRYVEAIVAGRAPEAGSERLDRRASRLEALQLSLRTEAGVPVDALSPADRQVLAPLVRTVDDGHRIVLSPAGRLLANEVALRLRADTSGRG